MEAVEHDSILLVVKSTELALKLLEEFCATAKPARTEVNRRVMDSMVICLRCQASLDVG